MSIANPQTTVPSAADPSATKPRVNARDAMESLNAEAGKFNIWLRTQANAPAQRPWFRDTGIEVSGTIAAGRVGANQIKTADATVSGVLLSTMHVSRVIEGAVVTHN